MIPIICFVGPSGVGKTTVLEMVIRELKSRHIRVAAVKHARHHGFEIDQPGKDSWRFGEAGSDVVILSSLNRLSVIHERTDEATLQEMGGMLEGKVDIILAEGYKKSNNTKIEVFRPEVCQYLTSSPEDLLAVISDVNNIEFNVPLFSFLEISLIADFIIETVIQKAKCVTEKEIAAPIDAW